MAGTESEFHIKCDRSAGSQKVLILLGPPGAGKGTQSETLVKNLKVPHISTGDILRDHIRRETALGKQVKETLDRGGLVSDDLVLNMLAERVGAADCAIGFILDGFPRTLEQAELLDAFLAKRDVGEQRSLPLVIRLKVEAETLLRRLGGRQVCPACHVIYSAELRPPMVDGLCDMDESGLITREDDKKETILRRLKLYEEQIAPIIGHYSKSGSVMDVNGERPVEEISKELLSIVRNAWRIENAEYGLS